MWLLESLLTPSMLNYMLLDSQSHSPTECLHVYITICCHDDLQCWLTKCKPSVHVADELTHFHADLWRYMFLPWRHREANPQQNILWQDYHLSSILIGKLFTIDYLRWASRCSMTDWTDSIMISGQVRMHNHSWQKEESKLTGVGKPGLPVHGENLYVSLWNL